MAGGGGAAGVEVEKAYCVNIHMLNGIMISEMYLLQKLCCCFVVHIYLAITLIDRWSLIATILKHEAAYFTTCIHSMRDI